MIRMKKNKNIWGFHIEVEGSEKFVRIGTEQYLLNLSEEGLKKRIAKAKEIERIFCCDSFRPPVILSDMIRGNKLKFIQASSGRVKLQLPKAAPKTFKINPVNIDSDVQYLTMMVFNHFDFPTNGMTFQVAKSLVKTQLYSAR